MSTAIKGEWVQYVKGNREYNKHKFTSHPSLYIHILRQCRCNYTTPTDIHTVTNTRTSATNRIVLI